MIKRGIGKEWKRRIRGRKKKCKDEKEKSLEIKKIKEIFDIWEGKLGNGKEKRIKIWKVLKEERREDGIIWRSRIEWKDDDMEKIIIENKNKRLCELCEDGN